MPLRKIEDLPALPLTAQSVTVAPPKMTVMLSEKKADKPMSRDDWAAKDTRISRQGLFQAALQSPALMQYAPTLEAYIELVTRTAIAGLSFVNQGA